MEATQKPYSHSTGLDRIIRIMWLMGLILFPVVLLLLPATYFDTGHSICLITLTTGQECYGCGITRSIMHLIHFDFLTAWNYNKIAFIVLPILCVLYLEMIVRNMYRVGIIRNDKIIRTFDQYFYHKRSKKNTL